MLVEPRLRLREGLEGPAKRRALTPVATGTRPPARPSLVTGQGWAASVLALATVWTFPCLRSLSLWLGCAHGVLSPSGPRESLSQSLQPSLLGWAGPRPHVLLRPGVVGRERPAVRGVDPSCRNSRPAAPAEWKEEKGPGVWTQGRPFHALPLFVSGHSPNCTTVRWGGGDHASPPLEQAGCERDPGAERSGQEECVGTHGRPSSPRTFAASQQMWDPVWALPPARELQFPLLRSGVNDGRVGSKGVRGRERQSRPGAQMRPGNEASSSCFAVGPGAAASLSRGPEPVCVPQCPQGQPFVGCELRGAGSWNDGAHAAVTGRGQADRRCACRARGARPS